MLRFIQNEAHARLSRAELFMTWEDACKDDAELATARELCTGCVDTISHAIEEERDRADHYERRLPARLNSVRSATIVLAATARELPEAELAVSRELFRAILGWIWSLADAVPIPSG